jgi:hypothetical protein
MKTGNGWDRLVATARSAPETRDEAAPFGFAARVAARASAPRRRPAGLAEMFTLGLSLRALGAAAALALAAAGVGYPSAARLFSGVPQPTPIRSVAPVKDAAHATRPAQVPAESTPSTSAPGDDPVTELAELVS